jgi:indolepyruvate ferredoxin oxidoreductase
MLPLLRILARMKFLRGTRFDPFGRSQERRAERQLIDEYEQLVDEILADLEFGKFGLAVEILALPDSVKGYGLIKDQSITRYRQKLERLRKQWRQSVPQRQSEERASAA